MGTRLRRYGNEAMEAWERGYGGMGMRLGIWIK